MSEELERERPERPPLSAEEQEKQAIQQADDAVQVRYHLLAECGTPMVSVVYRSAKLQTQVREQIEHHAVKDGDEVIGYARQGSVLTIEAYGAEPEVALEVTGERAR